MNICFIFYNRKYSFTSSFVELHYKKEQIVQNSNSIIIFCIVLPAIPGDSPNIEHGKVNAISVLLVSYSAASYIVVRVIESFDLLAVNRIDFEIQMAFRAIYL
jgi:hypothetical protein